MRVRLWAVVAALAVLGACGPSAGGGSVQSEGPVSAGGWTPLRGAASSSGEQVAFLGWPESGRITQAKLVLAGSDPVTLGPAVGDARAFAWMPDGESLLLSYGDETMTTAPSRFVIIDLDGEIVREIPLDRQLYGASGLAVAPDGGTALFPAQAPSQFSEATDLWELNLDSGELRQVTATPDQREDEPVYVDDSTVIITTAEQSLGDGEPSGQLAQLNLDSGEVTPLTGPNQVVGSSAVDPSGRFVVYDAFPGNRREDQALWIVDLEKGSPELLLEAAARFPSFSDEGALLVLRPSDTPGPSRLEWLEIPEAPWVN